MAVALRTERSTAARPARRPAPQRVTGRAADAARRPALAVVPRRRRAAHGIVALSAVAIVLMLGAAAFQTQLARRQVTLDILDRQIRAAHDTYDVLRRERAELRSPGRLVEQATLLGMRPAAETEFVAVSPDVVAAVQSTGATGGSGPDGLVEEFVDFAAVKSEAGRAP